MADYYVDVNGNISTKKNSKKKKKKQADYIVDKDGKITTVNVDDDIAPVKSTVKKREEDDSKLDFFQKSMAFDDGWQRGDLEKTILSSAGDAGLEVVRGVGGLVEGVTDLVGYGIGGVADLFGADDFAAKMKKNAQEKSVEKWTQGADDYLEQNSIFGRTSDAILQGIGQVGGIIATGGIAGAAAGAAGLSAGATTALSTAATTGLMGLSGMGSGMGEAYEGGATDGQAVAYGAISGVADALTELLFGGLGKAVKATGLSVGLSSADDMLAKKVSNLFSSQITKNLAEFGIKAGAEGFEEVLAGTAQAIGKKITYMKEEELSEILKDENLLEQFVVGAATSGMLQSGYIPGSSEGSLREANKEGRDFITGLNQNEQAVVDKEVEKRISAEEKSGKTLTKKEKNKIYDDVLSDMDRGGISIDTIEEVLGGETYTNYKKVSEAEDAMQREYDELGKKEKFTLEDYDRRKELADRLKYVREKGAKNELKSRLDSDVSSMVKDSRLVESYNERTRRGQKFEVDLTQYKDEKQKAIVQKAVESGILNNTRRTHEFVDMVARIAADKGVSFDFTNNKKLKESGFAIDGKQVNGFVTKDGITVNIQSSKSLNSVVGHEITHVLEGTELYAELQKAVFQYAESKKDLAGRRGTLTALYQGVEGANIDAELTADLVGDYLFTDSDFINDLSANHNNVFQKIYDEVKYLLKVATAGSKEARQLEQVKRAFEKAYRAGGKNNTAEKSGTTYSMSQQGQTNTHQSGMSFTPAEIQAIQGIGRKSVSAFTSADIAATEKFARKYWSEMGAKSPFFRSWFGDWRSGDTSPVQTANVQGDLRGTQQNVDTGWDIQVSGKVFNETRVHSASINTAARQYLPYINDIVKKAVLLDSYAVDGAKAKSQNSLLMHSMYAVADIGNGPEVLKLYVEEMNNPNSADTAKRAYQLQNIEKYRPTGKSSQNTVSSISPATGNALTVADLFGYVKSLDANFNPNSASKIVNADGTPKVMYHGSNAQFTKFDKSKAKSSGLYGKGFYFTDSASHAGTYGNQYEVYLDIRNPLQEGAATVTRSQVRSYLEAIAENEDYSIENYGTYDIDKVLDIVMGKNSSADAFAVIQDINATAVGDMVEAAELFNTTSGTNFDGIVVPTETVAFRPEQIKSATDNIGTFDKNNPDIRFSLSSPVEVKGNLMAIHNVYSDKLMDALRLGGLPSPSVAVTKSDMEHSNYGEISLILPRESIDPQADKRNKVYGSDAWTPTSNNARTEYEVNWKKMRAFEQHIAELGKKAAGGAFVSDSAVRRTGVEDATTENAAKLAERLARTDEVRAAYLADTGKTVEPEYKTKQFNEFGNDSLQKYIDRVGVQHLASVMAEAELGNTEAVRAEADVVRQIMRDWYADKNAFSLNKRPELKELRIDGYMKNRVSMFTIEDFVRDAWEFYQDDGSVTNVIDRLATSEKVRNAASEAEVQAWLEPQIAEFLGEPGIYNGKDMFTPSGKRRSFAETHFTYTAENIVKAMQMAAARGEGTHGAHATSVIATATPSYNSVEEMHADEGRLRVEDKETYDNILAGIDDRLQEIEHDIMRTTEHHADNTFDEEQIIGSIITQAATGQKTVAGIQRAFAKEDYRISAAQAEQILELYNEAASVPTGYFEAKPERVVGFDEVAVFVIPNNLDIKLKQELLNRGYTIAEYDPSVEGHRQKVVNQFDQYKFSLSNVGAEQRTFGNYNVYGEDVALDSSAVSEDIAPVRLNIPPASKTPVQEAAPEEDIAPLPETAQEEEISPLEEQGEAVTHDEAAEIQAAWAKVDGLYEEYDALAEQAADLEQKMYEAHDAGYHDTAMEINEAWMDVRKTMEETKAQAEEETDAITKMTEEIAAHEQERLNSFADEDAPVVGEAPYNESTDSVTLPVKRRNDLARDARKALGFSKNRVSEMRELIDKFSRGEIDIEQLYDEIADRFGTYTETERHEDVAEVRHWLRTVPINVSKEVQSDFADYASSIQRPNRGRLLFSKKGSAVDAYYAELADKFPGFFPSDIINSGDQLNKIVEVAHMDIESKQEYDLDEQALEEVVDTIILSVNEYKQRQRREVAEANSKAAYKSLMADADRYAPPVEEDIAPVRADVTPATEDIAPVREDIAPVAAPAESAQPEAVGSQRIKTVPERVAAELQSLETELANNKRLREESNSDFDVMIQAQQAEYDGKRKKNTKVANEILRRIERFKQKKAETDADYSKRISDLESRVAKKREELRTGESKEAQSAMRQELKASKVEEIRTALAADGIDLDEMLKNAKNMPTLATVDNTPQRVNEKTFGYKAGQILNRLLFDRQMQHTTEGTKWLNTITNRKDGLLAQLSKQYNIKPGSKESEAAQMYAEGYFVDGNDEKVAYGDRELAMDFPDVKVQENIKGLARDPRIRQFYDETLAMINESRTRNAYPAIQPLKNYFLHFHAMEDIFSKIGIPFNPNDINAKDLPTDINGMTADLKPGQPYFASANHRRGIKTTFDLLGGLERYAKSAMPQIYYIDDIQMERAFRDYIAEMFGQAKGLENLDEMTEEERQERIAKVYDSHLSTYAKFLNEQANVTAGKTTLVDRAVEGIFGRRGITALNTLNRQVGANMVGFNVSSSLTNFIAAVQAFAKTNKASFVKGFAQTVANRVGAIAGKSDGFAESNPTMIRRKGADDFYRTPWQVVTDWGYALMGGVDSITTEMIVRSKIDEFVKKGMSAEQAVIEADKWTSRLMGDRTLGQQPQLYNSKMLGLFTKFQLEVRNQLDSMFYDTIQEAKASNEDIENAKLRNAKTAAQVTSTIVQLAVTSHLFGKAFEAVAGYNPAFDIIEAIIKAFGWDDEEDSEDTVLDNLGQGLLSIAEDMPYYSVLSGTGRIPISSALPITQLIKGEDKYGNEKSRLETLTETVPYYLLPAGYGQIKKTAQGLGMFNLDEDHPVAGSYTSSGNLRYPVEDTLLNRAQAAVFGQYASSNARDYFDNEYTALKKNQIQEFVDSGLSIQEYRDYREGLKGKDTLGEKVAYIASLDMPIETKNLLVNNIADREEPIDLTNFGEYDDWGEFEYAHKYPEKYDFLKANNISVEQYENFDEETKEAWSWAYQNPEKFTLSRSITDDLLVYRQYIAALNDLSADKTADGKTISGSRKKKVLEYINALDADYYAKLILFKMEYPSDDTYNREIIEYLNGRSDISYEEEVTILKELGFVVLPDGTVQW